MTAFQILPYALNDGIPTFADSQLGKIYDQIVKEEKDYIFSDGMISDEKSFVEMAKSERTAFYVVYHGEKPVLVVWLNRFEGAMARLNFCSINGVSREIKISAGRYIINRLTEKAFDLLVGYVPETNRMAIEYVKACGAKVLGAIPNLVWDDREKKSKPGVVLYYEGQRDENLQ
jgi:hypothetical protein